MEKIYFFDTKPYDKEFFEQENQKHGYELVFLETKLTPISARIVKDARVVCAFVNDQIGADTLQVLYEQGVELLAMRCAGYNNVDLQYAHQKIKVVRVPAYSPYAVAEHAMAMLLTLNRKLHKAYIRVRDQNFSLNGLTGFDLHGKTIGVIGTGKIGRVFMEICKGFGVKLIAYDPFPLEQSDITYVDKEELFSQADIISLHCPLTRDSYHLINHDSIALMKDGVYIINTSRGALIDSEALLEAIKQKKVAGAALDVYEEEAELFYEDNSGMILQDDILARLISMPNVLVTSHQAFLTKEALTNIAETTLANIDDYFQGKILKNQVLIES